MSAISKRRLKTWIRLLRATRTLEAQLRDHLRRECMTTMPRFDVLAALQRSHVPLTMTELSRQLLVSNGNTTTVVDRLESDGLVVRTPSPDDRRSVNVSLTIEGERCFAAWAESHERQIDELFASLGRDELERFDDLLHRLDGEHPTKEQR